MPAESVTDNKNNSGSEQKQQFEFCKGPVYKIATALANLSDGNNHKYLIATARALITDPFPISPLIEQNKDNPIHAADIFATLAHPEFGLQEPAQRCYTHILRQDAADAITHNRIDAIVGYQTYIKFTEEMTRARLIWEHQLRHGDKPEGMDLAKINIITAEKVIWAKIALKGTMWSRPIKALATPVQLGMRALLATTSQDTTPGKGKYPTRDRMSGAKAPKSGRNNHSTGTAPQTAPTPA